jgi:hypothetical protein
VTTVADPAVITAADIPWELAAAPRPTAEDVLLDALVTTDSYRLLASAAIHHSHALHLDVQRLQQRYDRLLDKYRSLREQVLRSVGA